MAPLFGTNIWKKHQEVLERINRRTARFVMNDYSPTSSVTSMLDALGWPSLECRRQCQRLVFMYKISMNSLLYRQPTSYLLIAVPEHNTSSSSELSQLHRQYTKICYFQGQFLAGTLHTVKLWTATLWIDLSQIQWWSQGHNPRSRGQGLDLKAKTKDFKIVLEDEDLSSRTPALVKCYYLTVAHSLHRRTIPAREFADYSTRTLLITLLSVTAPANPNSCPDTDVTRSYIEGTVKRTFTVCDYV